MQQLREANQHHCLLTKLVTEQQNGIYTVSANDLNCNYKHATPNSSQCHKCFDTISTI